MVGGSKTFLITLTPNPNFSNKIDELLLLLGIKKTYKNLYKWIFIIALFTILKTENNINF